RTSRSRSSAPEPRSPRVLVEFSWTPHLDFTRRVHADPRRPHRIEVIMSIAHDTARDTGTRHRVRRFRLIRGGARGHDRVVPEPPPKQVLLSPRSARWLPNLGEALGPSYRVVLETHDTPAAIVIDSREDDLEQLVQQQRASTRIVVVHTGHPSEQPMT